MFQRKGHTRVVLFLYFSLKYLFLAAVREGSSSLLNFYGLLCFEYDSKSRAFLTSAAHRTVCLLKIADNFLKLMEIEAVLAPRAIAKHDSK